MRSQWVKFLNDNKANWSYGIVPMLVERLADAMDKGDFITIRETLEDLYYQGIVMDNNGNLCFLVNSICSWL